MIGQKVPLKMYTDSKSLFDIITKCSHTTEKRLMIDVAAVREGYERFEISDIGFIRSEHNIAVGLTKLNGSKALLRMLGGTICHPTEQWIIRTVTQSDDKKEGMLEPHMEERLSSDHH